MSRTPPRILTDPTELARLNAWIVELDDEAIVRVALDGGGEAEGIVSARPTIEIFRDAAGNEGHNALLRLDDLEDPAKAHYIWLDTVRGITHEGTA